MGTRFWQQLGNNCVTITIARVFCQKGGSSRPGETCQLLVLTGVDKDDPGPASARCIRFLLEQQEERYRSTCYGDTSICSGVLYILDNIYNIQILI